MAKSPKLKDDRVKDRIVEDVLQQVADGELQPGDKLAPVRRMCDLYGVSQRIVDQAKAELVARGVLENRPRSGSYIAGSLEASPAGPPAGGTSIKRTRTTDPALSTFSGMFRYYFPQLAPCTLRIYVCEALSMNLDLWRVLLKDFCETRPNVEVEMLTCMDGHVEDLIDDQRLDIVMATPVLLNALGPDRFLDVSEFVQRLAAGGDLLEIVPREGPFVRDFVGVPFSISQTYLFINQDLAEKAGAGEFAPDTAADFFAVLTALAPKLKEHDASPMVGPGLNECLFMTGALSLDKRGKLHLDINRAINCLETMARPEIFLMPPPGDLEAFYEGRAMCMTNSSFQVVQMLENEPEFPWRVLPPPVDKGAQLPAILMALAIDRNTANANEALHLITHLLTKRSQAEFGRLPGNLPVLRSALERPPLVPATIMPPATREVALARNSLTWNEVSRARFLAHGGIGGMKTLELLNGRLTPREAVEHLWLMAH